MSLPDEAPASMTDSLAPETAPPARTIAVSGASGAVGARVLRRLAASFDAVIDLDAVAAAAGPQDATAAGPQGALRAGPHDASADALARALAGVEALVHLRLRAEVTSQRLRRVLAAAADVRHLTLVSSASIYGAWPNNPMPISEDKPVRPNPESPYAVHHADAERTALEWRDSSATRQAAILRPAPVVSSESEGPFGEAMVAAAPIRTGTDDPPVQFLHTDDLASAVVLAAGQPLSGVYNVAPDGWLTPGELRSLLGARPKIRLPLPLPKRLDRFVARRVGHGVAEGLLPYTRYSWVVANDRLRAAGWQPRYSSAQAFVTADSEMPWAGLNARQRQTAALLGAAAAVAFGGWAAAAWLRRSYALR